MRPVTAVGIGIFFIIICIVLIRTWTLSVRSDRVAECKIGDRDFVEATSEVIGRFQQALRFRTVSTEPYVYDSEELKKMTSFIKRVFPAIHSSSFVKCEDVANYSLLYSVKGDNPDLTPYMITGHIDVVPADASLWDFPPFDATLDDVYIYARGTIDDKHTVMGVLEALEHLLSIGFRPQRSFYIGIGHDEEVTGLEGARSISNLLQSRGLKKLEFLVDEGLTIINQIIPGIDKPVALIGTSEKGYLTLELKVKHNTGHSSMPTKETSISILSNAVTKLTRDCHPSMFGHGPEIDTFHHLATEMKLPYRIVMSNLWLFSPLVSWVLSWKDSTNAVTRTVTSVTMIKGGVKVNVLPPEATGYVNHRIHPAQTVQEVIDYDKKLIADDRVKISIMSSMEPLPMSPYGDDDFGFQTLKNSIEQVWPDSVQAPGVMVGNTDTRHYTPLTHNIYRFSPTFMYPDDVPRFHGNNERISLKNYEQAINFFVHLIKNADLPSLPPYHKHTEEL